MGGRRDALLTVGLVLLAGWLGFSQDHLWPMWRHDAQRTGRSQLVGPARASDVESEVILQGSLPHQDYIYQPVIDREGTLYFLGKLKGCTCTWPT